MIVSRAQQGAEQLLSSAGLGDEQLGRVADAIVRAAEQTVDTGRTPGTMPRSAAASQGPPPAAAEPPVSPPSAGSGDPLADEQDDGEEQPRDEPA